MSKMGVEKQITNDQIEFLNILNTLRVLNTDVVSIISMFADSPIRKKKKSLKLNKQKAPTIVLPFCGIINREHCYAMKKNHGLYTQCKKKKKKGCEYCTVCMEAARNSPTEKPPQGDIRERDGLKAENKLPGLILVNITQLGGLDDRRDSYEGTLIYHWKLKKNVLKELSKELNKIGNK